MLQEVAAGALAGSDSRMSKAPSMLGTARASATPALLHVPDVLVGEQLRVTVHHGLQNIGLVSAFMAALSDQIYTSQPELGACWGEPALQVITVMQWMAMGFFFFTTTVTVVLSLDIMIDGVPG